MKFLTLTLLISFSLLSMDIPVQGPRALGQIKAHYDGHDFWIEKLKRNNIRQLYHVERWRLCEVLRSCNKEQLQQLIQHGYLQANKNNAGEYSLTFQGRIRGGGPILGEVAYWGTKIFAWGAISVGIKTGLKKIFTKEEPAYHNKVCPNSAADNATYITNVSKPTDNPLSVVIPAMAAKVIMAPIDWGGTQCMMKPAEKVIEHGIKNSGYAEAAATLTVGTMAATGTGLVTFVEGLANGARWVGRLIPWL